MTVKVVGWELAGSRGGSEIGGVITGKGQWKLVAEYWQITGKLMRRVLPE